MWYRKKWIIVVIWNMINLFMDLEKRIMNSNKLDMQMH